MADGFAATITGVREIAVTGRADPDYWRKRLASERLVPFSLDGRAELMILLTDARWIGWPFRELVFTVTLADPQDLSARRGAYLFWAAHSSPVLSWMERTFFRTPYFPARIDLDRETLAEFRLMQNDRVLVDASPGRGASATTPGPDLWDDLLYLPGGKECFRARLSGTYSAFAFDAARGRFDLSAARPGDPVYPLAESGFTPLRWSFRRDAVHSRSKTFLRLR